MHQVSRTVDSITLSWSQPDQPNGVILDYELQYYEKVPVLPGALPTPTPTSLGPGVLPSRETGHRESTGLGVRLPGSVLTPVLPSCGTSGRCFDLS